MNISFIIDECLSKLEFRRQTNPFQVMNNTAPVSYQE